ncbi:MAG: hypothetical protein LUD68_07145 [Rikenellaceae bacterium]|nr:hypothetical protein [Rikenellaceae bacterium]
MKTVYLFLLGALCICSYTMQAQSAIFDIQPNSSIESKSYFVDPLLWYNHLNSLAPYQVEKETLDSIYEITLNNYRGLEDDGGYFRNIIISYKNTEILNIRQAEGWTKIDDRFAAWRESEYFMQVDLGSGRLALIFVGAPYAGDPQQLTIVVLDHGQASVVFHGKYFINAVTSPFEMEVQFNFPDYYSPERRLPEDILHRIYLENGVLYFQDL